MPANDLELLKEAVARNAAVVISLPSAGMLRHHKTRFLAECAEGLWIESIPAESPLIDALIQSAHPVGISFKGPELKTAFAVPILRREERYAINANVIVQAVLTAMPAVVKTVQRRSNYRVHVPDACPLAVRAWRIAEHAVLRDRPLASSEVKLTVRDLSAGGMGVIIHPRGDGPVKLVSEQRLRIEVKYGDEIELILDGTLRHKPEAKDGSGARVGIQFKKLENDLTGRQSTAALMRIVGELQREEVRRARLGLAS